MKKWEYRIVTSDDVQGSGFFKTVEREAVQAHLNELGEQGWEVVNAQFSDFAGALSLRALLKRERPG